MEVSRCIEFFTLMVQGCKTKVGSRNILCSIQKEQKGWWKGILKSEEKPAPYLKVDWNKWCDEDEEESTCKFRWQFLCVWFYDMDIFHVWQCLCTVFGFEHFSMTERLCCGFLLPFCFSFLFTISRVECYQSSFFFWLVGWGG